MLSRERVERADSRMWGVEEIDGGQRMRVRVGEGVVAVGVVKSEVESTRTAGGGGMVGVIGGGLGVEVLWGGFIWRLLTMDGGLEMPRYARLPGRRYDYRIVSCNAKPYTTIRLCLCGMRPYMTIGLLLRYKTVYGCRIAALCHCHSETFAGSRTAQHQEALPHHLNPTQQQA